ncbi:mycofactocin-coupled SDR family oxidoreductase [Pseudonocardia sp. N23]|uniref:mycofactocin-coupled SDR family oxidoreductase n=1 Tax=Pseudonocardia sp. N23 TaxID=1987376 RepID=UPI000BFDB4C7|nr:mycofactocin-coupled SDR family oxidoreductase [Pseudonocardia sp. N23]GAY07248.1 short-chain dehydrogenase [Pseudonocardia sp. N23]
MAGKLEGKVAFVTGAARSQGRSHAIRLAQEGADIIAVDLCGQVDTVEYPMSTPEDLKETVRLIEDLDRRIVATEADVRDYAALSTAVDAGVSALGRLDIVCGNAGIVNLGMVHELSLEQWNTMIDVNLTGVFHTCKAAVPHIIAGGRGGSITLTSTAVALRPVQGAGHYIAAKHGVVGLMQTLALELAPHFIRVNTIHPTNCDTDMIQNPAMRKAFVPDSEHPTREESEPAYTALNALPIPWIEPRDISNAIAFLASDEGRYITGISLPVDAGFQRI